MSVKNKYIKSTYLIPSNYSLENTYIGENEGKNGVYQYIIFSINDKLNFTVFSTDFNIEKKFVRIKLLNKDGSAKKYNIFNRELRTSKDLEVKEFIDLLLENGFKQAPKLDLETKIKMIRDFREKNKR